MLPVAIQVLVYRNQIPSIRDLSKLLLPVPSQSAVMEYIFFHDQTQKAISRQTQHGAGKFWKYSERKGNIDTILRWTNEKKIIL